MKANALKNKWAIGAIIFSLATIAAYLFLPLFNIPLLGIETGIGYVKLLWKMGDYANMLSFMLPFIGGLGAIVTAFFSDRGPHILTIAFALLPAMFFAYFLIMLSKLIGTTPADLQVFSLFEVAGSGVWIGLLSSLLALASAILIVVKDAKNPEYKE